MNTHSRSGLAGAPLPLNNNNIRTGEPPRIDPPRNYYWGKYFQDVSCPFTECPQALPLVNLPHHVACDPHWLPTHRYLAAPLSFSRTLLTSTTGTPQLMSCDPIRFTFAQENFYLQTIASPDRRLLYHFVQVEGAEEDSRRFWVKISVNSLDRSTQAGHATMTMRPTILDGYRKSNLQAIGNALVMTER